MHKGTYLNKVREKLSKRYKTKKVYATLASGHSSPPQLHPIKKIIKNNNVDKE